MSPISRGFLGHRREGVDPSRVPPGQHVTSRFPVLSAGPTPHTPLDKWSFTVPFVTWLLMGYFESIPEELEEAAMIDGATRFGAFYRIVLPLAAPGLLAAGLYAFTQAWNEFLIVVQRKRLGLHMLFL